jgi:hypothetical protein
MQRVPPLGVEGEQPYNVLLLAPTLGPVADSGARRLVLTTGNDSTRNAVDLDASEIAVGRTADTEALACGPAFSALDVHRSRIRIILSRMGEFAALAAIFPLYR